MKNTITKKDVLTKAVSLDAFTEDEKTVLTKMIEGLEKKSSKPTKAQLENVSIKNDILEVIADGRARTAREIAEVLGISTNKVSALLRAIVIDGKAEKVPGAKSKDAPKYVGNADATPYKEQHLVNRQIIQNFKPQQTTILVKITLDKKSQQSKCTNFGKRVRAFLCNFSLDKICGAWYNGILALCDRTRATKKKRA